MKSTLRVSRAIALAATLISASSTQADDRQTTAANEAAKYNQTHTDQIWNRIEIYVMKQIPNPDPKAAKTFPTTYVHQFAGTIGQMAAGLSAEQIKSYEKVKAEILNDMRWMQPTMRNGTPALWDSLARFHSAQESGSAKIAVTLLNSELENKSPTTIQLVYSFSSNQSFAAQVLDRIVRRRNETTAINSTGKPVQAIDPTFDRLWKAWNHKTVLQGDQKYTARDGTQKSIGAESPIGQITWAYQDVFSSAYDSDRTAYLELGRRLGLDVLKGPQQDHYRLLYGMMAQIAASGRPMSSFSQEELAELREKSTEPFVTNLLRSSVLAYAPEKASLQYNNCATRIGALAR